MSLTTLEAATLQQLAGGERLSVYELQVRTRRRVTRATLGVLAVAGYVEQSDATPCFRYRATTAGIEEAGRLRRQQALGAVLQEMRR